MKRTGKRILSVFLALFLAAGLLAVMPVVSSAAYVTVDLDEIQVDAEANGKNLGEEIQNAIQSAVDHARLGTAVKVVGEVEDFDTSLSLNVPANKSVIWGASISQVELPVAPDLGVGVNSGGTGAQSRLDDGRIMRTSSTRATISFYANTGETGNNRTSFFMYALVLEANAPAPTARQIWDHADRIDLGVDARANTASVQSKYIQRDIPLQHGDWDIFVIIHRIGGVPNPNDPLANGMQLSTVLRLQARTRGLPLIQLSGGGTFEVVEGAEIKADTIAIGSSNTNVLVSGGKIDAGSVGVNSNTGNVTVTGGEVTASGAGGEVIVSGGFSLGQPAGVVRANGVAIRTFDLYSSISENMNTRSTANGNDAHSQNPGRQVIFRVNTTETAGKILVAGGKVSANNAIEVASARNDASVTVSGGEVIGQNSAIRAADFAVSYPTVLSPIANVSVVTNTTYTQDFFASCDVTVTGGTVRAINGTAIITGDSYAPTTERRVVFVTGRTINYAGADRTNREWKSIITGAEQVATGNVTVSGGTVEGNVAIQKVSGNVTITGGEITGTAEAVREIASRTQMYQTVNSVATPADTISAQNIQNDPYIFNTNGRTARPVYTISGGTVTGAAPAFAIGDGTLVVKDGEINGGFTMDGGLALIRTGTVEGTMTPGTGGLIVEADIDVDAETTIALEGTSENLSIESGTGTAVWDTTRGKSVIMIDHGSRRAEFDWGVLNMSGLALSAPTLNRTSDTAATFGFTAGTAGTAYVMVLNANAATPSAAVVRQGIVLGDVPAGVVSGRNVALTKGPWSIFVVLQDASGNFSNVLRIEAPEFELMYTVIVDGGTGAGSFLPGATVNIVANAAPEGRVFDKWTSANGVIFANENAASTSFVMPAGNVTVTASYKIPPPPPSCTPESPCGDCEDCLPPVPTIPGTNYPKTAWNWFMFIVLFGWIWMRFI